MDPHGNRALAQDIIAITNTAGFICLCTYYIRPWGYAQPLRTLLSLSLLCIEALSYYSIDAMDWLWDVFSL